MGKTVSLLFLALAFPIAIFGQTAANRTTLNSAIDSRLPSGTGGLTAANLRLMFKDVTASSWNSLTDGVPQLSDPDLTSFASLTGTDIIAYRTAANTWGALTLGSGLLYTPNVDPTTGGVLSSTGGGGGGSGTVTSASVTSGNGFAGTVSTASTTPAILISTTVTGIIKGNGTAATAAVAGTDYLAPGAIAATDVTSGTFSTSRMPVISDKIGFGFDGGGAVITTGAVFRVRVSNACTVTGWALGSTGSGTITTSVRKGTPSSGTVTTTAIDGGTGPSLTAQAVNSSTSLGSWTATTFAAGDYCDVVVTGSPTGVTWITGQINITRTY